MQFKLNKTQKDFIKSTLKMRQTIVEANPASSGIEEAKQSAEPVLDAATLDAELELVTKSMYVIA